MSSGCAHQNNHCRKRTLPKIRPDLPLNNSNESGFFFCGMILDPVLLPPRNAVKASTVTEKKDMPTYLYASFSVTNPNSAVEYTIKSSASRLMCVIVKLDHIKNSTIKSRSPTPHMLFSAKDANPSSRARNSRSTANGLPARAPLPSGRMEMRGMSCRRRSRSFLNENACESKKWDQRIG